ncbi:MAG: DNA-3-methyladenine glycosylase [Anaerolineaceae bacterium]
MSDSTCLPAHFYKRDVVQVARDLLGMKLVRLTGSCRQEGIILETEAYRGEEDLACHAHVGQTRRNAVMYGPPGRAYVYFTYGIHWMLNCVCQDEGSPAAVLIRKILPTLGLEEIAARREGRPPPEWADGPAKLCQAFQIDGSLNGIDLTTPAGGLFIEDSAQPPGDLIQTFPRIGIKYAPEPWLSIPWRFNIDADLFRLG